MYCGDPFASIGKECYSNSTGLGYLKISLGCPRKFSIRMAAPNSETVIRI